MYAQETFCDGEWVEDIVSYNCSSFNSSESECVSHAGCWFEENAYVGVYLWEDRCYGGTQTIDNSYCDGAMVESVWGCTDESALNYDPNANQDDGSCILCDGEWEEVTTTYNCSSLNDGVACENIEGCSWEFSWGGWGSDGGNGSSDCVGLGTTTNIYCDGELVILGCTDSENPNYNPEANTDDGSCAYTEVVLGCTDVDANNYDPNAIEDDGSCDYDGPSDCENTEFTVSMIDSYGDGWNGNVLTVGNESVTLDIGSDGTATVCIDMSICNTITVDGGSWQSEVGWTLGDLSGGAPFEGQIGNCGDVTDVPGCTDESAINYNSSANIDDGSCSYENTSDCQNIYINLNNGWNMIGFSCSINTDAGIAFGPIQDKIIIAKDAIGNAYLPSWEFNGIGDLERGYGYLLKVSEEITNYNICE